MVIPKHLQWKEVEELEKYFKNNKKLPDTIKLNHFTTIKCSQFVDSHLSILKENNGNKTFLPFLNRLIEFQKKLNESNKRK
jgi:Zn-dependent M32 family carboxypeptidase